MKVYWRPNYEIWQFHLWFGHNFAVNEVAMKYKLTQKGWLSCLEMNFKVIWSKNGDQLFVDMLPKLK